MKIFIYLRNIFYNLFHLLKIVTKSNSINWSYLAGEISNCDIDLQAKIYNNHDLNNVKVGKGTYISRNANISNALIGKFCSIGPNLYCGWGVHPHNGISTSPVFYSKKKITGFTFSAKDKIEERKLITIGNDVFIGMNVIILDGVNIGDGAVIGAGAVVSKNIPPYAIAVGCPIKIIKYRFPKEIIDTLVSYRWWDQDEEVLRKIEKSFFDVESFIAFIKKET